MPRLLMLSGLPGSGKSTLGRALALQTDAVFLRIDVYEQSLRDRFGAGYDVGTLGYEEGYRLAADHLAAGRSVIADAVNAVEAAREGWRAVARRAGAGIIEVEIACSDDRLAAERLAGRDTGIPGLPDVDTAARSARLWEDNARAAAVIDTAGRSVDACVRQLGEVSGLFS